MADLLGPLPDNLVRVGYISTTRGYVDGLTVYQANVYAESNPGTTFVFEDGNNNVNYLKIDQVNQLTNEDIIRTEECKTEIVECGAKPPKIVISGGGGIGAAGNPIVDPSTGAIIAIDIISGGFGYTSPPTAEVVDDCNIGSGATLDVEVGAAPTYVETFDEVEDYNLEEPEEFQLDDEEIELYDPDGNLVGRWDPVDYYPDPADLGELDDPIQKEILEYQNLIRTIKNPWWTTRAIKPGSIISGTQSFPQAYNVILPPDLRTNLERSSAKVWTGFMDTYAISPVPPSNVRGSDYAGKLFTLNWSVNFPYDGEYIFRGSCDNKSNLYIDQAKVFELGDFSSSPRLIKKFVKKGLHSLRIDLLNQEIYQNTPTTPINIPTPGKDIIGQVNHRFNNTENRDISLSSTGIVQSVSPESRESLDGSFGTTLSEKHYLVTLDGEYGNIVVIPGTSTAGGTGDAGISVARVQKETKTTFRVWFNRSGGFNTYVNSFTVKVISDPTTQSQTPQQLLPVASIEPSSSAPSIRVQTIFNTIDYIDKADVPLYRVESSPYNREFITKNGVTPVANPEEASAGQYVIRWQYVEFPVDGLYDVTVGGDDNVTVYIGNSATGGNIDNGSRLTPIEDGGDEVIIQKEGYREPGKPNLISPSQVFFKAGRYRIRVELDQVIDKSYLAVAIDIKTSVVQSQTISTRSWNENPMGVALTIEAPPAPIPQEIKPPQRGRCPNNPIWSTRDPGASQQWYPVEIPSDKSNKVGDQYINRYTMSPVPPLNTPNTDGSGVVWSNTWRINVPFTGNYRIDGTKRGVARIKIDGRVVTGLSGAAENFGSDLSWVQNNFAGWEDPKTSIVKVGRKSTFVRLTEGEHEIAVELIGIPKKQVNYVDEVIFSSAKSIDKATIPLYSTNFKGWTEFLNRENVTPCEKANSAPPPSRGISPPLSGPLGQVNHSFNNNTNQDILLNTSGIVVNVVPENRQSLDKIYSTDITAKHYTITLGSNYNNIRVTPGQQTGGATSDSNIRVAKIQKITDNTWKVWFNRSTGTNTFVNTFTVQAE